MPLFMVKKTADLIEPPRFVDEQLVELKVVTNQ